MRMQYLFPRPPNRSLKVIQGIIIRSLAKGLQEGPEEFEGPYTSILRVGTHTLSMRNNIGENDSLKSFGALDLDSVL